MTTVYASGTALWLTIQALPLIASPKLIVTMLVTESRSPTAIEEYFSRSLGLALITVAILTIVLTGSVPLTTTFSASAAGDDPDPYAVSTVTVTMTFHALSAVYAYTRYLETGQTSFMLSLLGSGGLAVLGVWTTMFASGGHRSRRTGADKRTSGFPFSNVEADKKNVGKKRR
ncbi:hypothetical protein MMC19_001018 [Ptychographa xylographoides]|nr:hypothetical protein [Ptychographa xylographoides]